MAANCVYPAPPSTKPQHVHDVTTPSKNSCTSDYERQQGYDGVRPVDVILCLTTGAGRCARELVTLTTVANDAGPVRVFARHKPRFVRVVAADLER